MQFLAARSCTVHKLLLRKIIGSQTLIAGIDHKREQADQSKLGSLSYHVWFSGIVFWSGRVFVQILNSQPRVNAMLIGEKSSKPDGSCSTVVQNM